MSTDITLLLLKNGARKDVLSNSNETPLDVAYRVKAPALIDLLTRTKEITDSTYGSFQLQPVSGVKNPWIRKGSHHTDILI
jgi:hypothetical protein